MKCFAVLITMETLEHLFANNRSWSEAIRRRDPEFFLKLSRQQAPSYLWIGCADSRVPANEIVDLLPGELFVHRNIANVVVHTDLNCLSVMQFAVDVLKVRHIMVVGHYGCSGVNAALRQDRIGLADNWLQHVQDVRAKHERKLECVAGSGQARCDRLCELVELPRRGVEVSVAADEDGRLILRHSSTAPLGRLDPHPASVGEPAV